MTRIEEMLEFNKRFVADEKYKDYSREKYPHKKIAVLSCMDTRLTELLPAALNFRNGDIKIIKNAGAVITHPYGSVMRSLLIAVYELGIEDIVVIGHYDCGMQGMDAARLISKMAARGIEPAKIEDVCHCIDITQWLSGFEKVEDAVCETVKIIRDHPFMPADIRIHGFVINPETGQLDRVRDEGL